MPDKIEEAKALSEQVLLGLETGSIKVSSACLTCLRIGRLLNDQDAIEWLEYEAIGYPRDGNFISRRSFNIGLEHGRAIDHAEKTNRTGFFELADELESEVDANYATLNTLTTQGLNISGDSSARALSEFTTAVNIRTGILLSNIKNAKHKLSTIRGEYYKYALKLNLSLKFSQQAEDTFHSYRLLTDSHLIRFAPEALKRLDAAYENLQSDNPESWSQALASCRRVFKELSENLFVTLNKDTKGSSYTTKSGKILDISGDNYKNKLYVIVDYLSNSKTSRKLIGSEIIYIIDWIECFHDLLSKGVHDDNPIDYDEARSGVLHTYMLLGDIANLLIETKSST